MNRVSSIFLESAKTLTPTNKIVFISKDRFLLKLIQWLKVVCCSISLNFYFSPIPSPTVLHVKVGHIRYSFNSIQQTLPLTIGELVCDVITASGVATATNQSQQKPEIKTCLITCWTVPFYHSHLSMLLNSLVGKCVRKTFRRI